MKKISIFIAATAICTLASVQAQAQESYMNDALTWSTNDIVGTARTLGMGNAVTAVGGDLGTIAFNPAGGAVSSFSQIVISPSLSISMVGAHGMTSSDGNTYLANSVNKNATQFYLPTIGANFCINTGNIAGLKRMNFGFVATSSNKYNRSISAWGETPYGGSSYAGCLADAATVQGYGNFDDLVALAWNCDAIGQNSGIPNGYAAVTENALEDGTAALGGNIYQSYNAEIKGGKTDYIFNFGMDFSDVVYVGMSLGATNLRYRFSDMIMEKAEEVSNFQSGFSSLAGKYTYKADGGGVYFQLGTIVTPWQGLRLGASIKTPTLFTIQESYCNSFQNSYLGGDRSQTGESNGWEFDLATPWVFNLGAAYTLGHFLLASVDYEYTAYNRIKYSPSYSESVSDASYCNRINNTITDGLDSDGRCLGSSHTVRVGVEYKPTEEFAVRLGYNFSSTPLRVMDNFYNRIKRGEGCNAFCAGIGYDSPGSFFCDLAARLKTYAGGNIQIYDDYTNRGLTKDGTYKLIGAPVIEYKHQILTVVATLGWRF